MNFEQFQIMAGAVSSVIFMMGTFPMLYKAWRTKDLRSYSLANIVVSNVGNFIHWFYILSLPFGPVWALHAFHTVTTLLMLVWYLIYVKFDVTARKKQKQQPTLEHKLTTQEMAILRPR